MDKTLLSEIADSLPEFCAMLRAVSDPSLEKMNVIRLGRETILYNEGEKDGNSLYIVLFGVCKILGAKNYSGCPLYLTRGSAFGTYEAVNLKVVPRTASVGSFTDVVLLEIPKDLLHGDLYTNNQPLIVWIVLRTIEKYHTDHTLVKTVRGDAVVKISGYLADIYRMCVESTDGAVTAFSVADTREMLATGLKISVRSVTRAVNTMKSLGLITLDKGKITVDREHYKRMEQYLLDNGIY